MPSDRLSARPTVEYLDGADKYQGFDDIFNESERLWFPVASSLTTSPLAPIPFDTSPTTRPSKVHHANTCALLHQPIFEPGRRSSEIHDRRKTRSSFCSTLFRVANCEGASLHSAALFHMSVPLFKALTDTFDNVLTAIFSKPVAPEAAVDLDQLEASVKLFDTLLATAAPPPAQPPPVLADVYPTLKGALSKVVSLIEAEAMRSSGHKDEKLVRLLSLHETLIAAVVRYETLLSAWVAQGGGVSSTHDAPPPPPPRRTAAAAAAAASSDAPGDDDEAAAVLRRAEAERARIVSAAEATADGILSAAAKTADEQRQAFAAEEVRRRKASAELEAGHHNVARSVLAEELRVLDDEGREAREEEAEESRVEAEACANALIAAEAEAAERAARAEAAAAALLANAEEERDRLLSEAEATAGERAAKLVSDAHVKAERVRRALASTSGEASLFTPAAAQTMPARVRSAEMRAMLAAQAAKGGGGEVPLV